MEERRDAPAGGAACWSCGARLDSGDRYCRRCGAGQGECLPWYYKHLGIVLLTVCALGPFSLFFVWRSPALSRNAKLVYAVLIVFFTLFLVDRARALRDFYQAALGLPQG